LGAINDFEGIFKKALGVSAQELERAWREWLTAQFVPQIEQIKSEGVTPSRKISRLGYWNNDPTWAPDGKFIYYYHKDPVREAAIRRITLDGREDQAVFAMPFELGLFQAAVLRPGAASFPRRQIRALHPTRDLRQSLRLR
jgi:hypothetical protein